MFVVCLVLLNSYSMPAKRGGGGGRRGRSGKTITTATVTTSADQGNNSSSSSEDECNLKISTGVNLIIFKGVWQLKLR